MIQERLVEDLKVLNLTDYEARTYLSLVERGIATVKEIREVAKIPYSREYDILESLEDRGYVVVQPGRPKLYCAVAPQEILSKELDRRSRVVEELIGVLTPIYNSSARRNSLQDVIWMLKGEKNVREKLLKMFRKAEKEICVLGTKPLEEKEVLEGLKEARGRGVGVRVLGNLEGLKEILEKAGVESRSFSHDHSRFVIVDGKELILTSEESSSVSCALYNQNPGCVKLYLNYFAHMWEEPEVSISLKR